VCVKRCEGLLIKLKKEEVFFSFYFLEKIAKKNREIKGGREGVILKLYFSFFLFFYIFYINIKNTLTSLISLPYLEISLFFLEKSCVFGLKRKKKSTHAGG
jgi:hypothetical protein